LFAERRANEMRIISKATRRDTMKGIKKEVSATSPHGPGSAEIKSLFFPELDEHRVLRKGKGP